MPITIDTVRSKGRVVADDERYTVHDFDLDDLTVSLTELKKGQATRGHSHDGKAEAYFFLNPKDAEMTIGKESFSVGRGAVLIPSGEFHRVANKSKDTDLVFVSVFTGKRGDTGVSYSSPGREGPPSGENAAAARA
jgi:quercetin dioxygenase-like cupin family protein